MHGSRGRLRLVFGLIILQSFRVPTDLSVGVLNDSHRLPG